MNPESYEGWKYIFNCIEHCDDNRKLKLSLLHELRAPMAPSKDCLGCSSSVLLLFSPSYLQGWARPL
jgi:hypothetical protein